MFNHDFSQGNDKKVKLSLSYSEWEVCFRNIIVGLKNVREFGRTSRVFFKD